MFLIKLNFNQLLQKVEAATSFMAPNSDDDLDICVSDEEDLSGCSDVDGTSLDFVYALFDTEIFISFINDVARCDECGESVKNISRTIPKIRVCSLFRHLVY